MSIAARPCDTWYRRRLLPAAAVAFVVLGAGLRFHQLGYHFAQLDDLFPIAGPYVMNQGQPRVVRIPFVPGAPSIEVDTERIKTNPILYAAYASSATYAPLQFTVFPLLLSGDYGYREFLTRGRLPSAISASLALIAFAGLYRAYRGGIDVAAGLRVAGFGLSLMNITYAQQSISYAIGVLGSALLLWMLIAHASRPTTMRRLLLWAAAGATLTYANYQVGVLFGIATLALAITEYRVQPATTFGPFVRRYVLAGIAYGVLVLPLAIPLHDKTGGVGRFAGVPGYEAFFPAVPDGGLIDVLVYVTSYAGRAAYTAVGIDVSFTTAGAAGDAGVAILFGLFLAGAWGLAVSADPRSRAVATFGALLAVTLAVLNATWQFPLSPSRHMLVFTPLIVLAIAVGVTHLRASLRVPFPAGEAGVWTLIAAMVVVFSLGYGQFRRERADRFDEARLAELMARHHVDTVVGYADTWQPALMFRREGGRVRFIDLDAILRKGPASTLQLPDRSFLLVSQHRPIDEYPADYPRNSAPPIRFDGYRLRELVRIESDVEPGISKAIKIGTNGLYVTLAEHVAS